MNRDFEALAAGTFLAICSVVAFVALVAGCGDDDDSGIVPAEVPEDGDGWFTTTSPSGVKVECLRTDTRRSDGGVAIWCREVPG